MNQQYTWRYGLGQYDESTSTVGSISYTINSNGYVTNVSLNGVNYTLQTYSLSVILSQGEGYEETTSYKTESVSEVDEDGNQNFITYYLDNNNERVARLETVVEGEGDNAQSDIYIVLITDVELNGEIIPEGTRIAEIDYTLLGEQEVRFTNEEYENILAQETILIPLGSYMTYTMQLRDSSGNSYTFSVDLDLDTSIFNDLYSSKLIANNIEVGNTNYNEEIPIITFTTSSLSSYAGVEDLEFNAANYGPTDETENTGLYYGPSYIDFSINTKDFKYVDGNISLDVTTSNDKFEYDEVLTGTGDNYSHQVSIDVKDTSMAFGDYDNKGNGYSYQFALTIPYSVAFGINNENSDTKLQADLDVDDLTKVSNGNIIITDNIYVLDMSSTINDMEIRGYNHLITEKLSLAVFDYAIKVRESGYIQDLNFAIVADAEANYVDKQNVKVMDVMATGETRITNVSVYGTVRKIDTVTDKNATGTVYIINISTGAENVEDSNSIDSLLTNLSLIGKDGESNYSVQETGSTDIDGESVNVNLQSYYSATASSSSAIGTDKTILVAGNGGNGSNGADGEISDNTSSPQGENGANGGNGGSGGTTTNSGETESESISIDGADGVAGNGGNGADGLVATTRNVAGGGGAGGNSGNAGVKSGNTGSEKIKSNRSYNNDLPGSGGSGGLGMYYNGGADYSSDSDYYHEYQYNGNVTQADKGTSTKGGGYSDTGYSTSLTRDSSYSAWIKTSGGGGSAGEMEIELVNSSSTVSSQAGTNGNYIEPNTKILQRGYNRYRSNTTATSGYYWNYNYGQNGRERLFGNLQMTSTFSYYGINPDDTGPRNRNGENVVSDRYTSIYDFSSYLSSESGAGWTIVGFEVAYGVALSVGIVFLATPLAGVGSTIISTATKVFSVATRTAFAFLEDRNSNMIFGDQKFFTNDRGEDGWFTLDDIPLLGAAFDLMLGIIGNLDLDAPKTYESGTFFEQGDLYYADGGFGDYWWLYDEKNDYPSNNNLNKTYLHALGEFLNGFNSSNYKIVNSAGRISDGGTNVWESNFYGGQGGGDGTGTNGNGGTSYTKEIYGYAKMDDGGIVNNAISEGDSGYKCFFTRNDYVTSAGIYGDAAYANVNNQRQLETPNFTVS